MSALKPELNIRVVSPFPEAAYFDLYDWAKDAWSAIADDFTPEDRDGFIELQLASAALPTVRTWGIYRGDELGGFARFETYALKPWTGEAHAIFKRSFWGRKTTVPALAQVAKEIFDMGALRIGMVLFEKNRAMQSLIANLGAKREGTFDMATIQKGEFINAVIYGLTPERLETALKPEEQALCQ